MAAARRGPTLEGLPISEWGCPMDRREALTGVAMAGLAAVAGPATAEVNENDPGGHVAWVIACLKDIGAVKAGTTRAEVEKRFRVAPKGYFRPNEAYYHYRECPLFSVWVKYTPDPKKKGFSNDSPDDTVAEVTGPYLNGTNVDLDPFGVR